ncbi:MAG: BTAD domain-containing putative transcriptional regulator [Anaerolineales bacterium]
MELTLSLLGETKICLDGGILNNLSAEKARALLFFLAVERDHAHRRDALAEVFWPEKPEGYGRNSLKQALTLLRGALGDRDKEEPFILASNRELQFNAGSPHWVDSLEFEELLSDVHTHSHPEGEFCEVCLGKLSKATALYRDDFLVDFYLPDSPEFNEWVLSRREAYKRMMVEILRNLITHFEGIKDFKSACTYGEHLVSLEPWSESSHRTQMRLLAACGKRSAALKQYHACESMLESEFGVKPTPETTALYEEIQQWDLDAREWEILPISLGEDDQLPAKIIKPPSPTQQFKGWVIGSVVLSFLVLVGIIYTALMARDGLGKNFTSNPSSSLDNSLDEEPYPGIRLEGAPADVLPSQICLPGEKTLYQENFEDDEALWWPEINFRVQGWDLVPDPLFPENLVVQNPGEHDTQIWNHGVYVENAVWRLNFMVHGKPSFLFHWYSKLDPYEVEAGRVENSDYSAVFIPDNIRLVRDMSPFPQVVLLDNPITVEKEVWHLLEISTYQGTYEIWADGVQIVEFVDPDPLPGGQIGLELWTSETEDSMVYYDNFQICELSAPFVPMYIVEP